ncbi:MAG: ribosomal-processing cysteine protease Prp [Acutalibacteraceae bacterium]|nr:ribosomal-processing cysteine protease Prp [Acutalibacteraceae bacterium]
MTRINLLTLANGELVGFRITGHSGFAESGSDIVCAAISSAAYLVANTITEVIRVSAEIDVNEDNGDMLLRVFQKDATACRDILQGFKLHMLALEEQYSDYMIVNNTEV